MRRPRFVSLAGLVAAAWIGMSPALGNDYFVDAVHGNDANTGTSAGQAWQTITHAFVAVPAPAKWNKHTIHVAPGTYDPALGEVFPLPMRPGLDLVGDGGSAVTVLDGASTGVELVRFDSSAVQPNSWPDPTLQGFSLRGAGTGIHVWGATEPLDLTLRDLSVESMAGAGITVLSLDVQIGITAQAVRSNGNARGLEAWPGPAYGSISLTLEDGELCANSDAGFRGADNIGLVLERCRVVDNTHYGIYATASLFGVAGITLRDTLLARNGDHGIWATGGPEPSPVRVTLERCTVAENGLIQGAGGSGLAVWSDASLRLYGCNLFGNQDDIYFPSYVQEIEYCNVGDGDFSGTGGNFSLDPLFVDPAAGDYRLSWNSPCAEAGDPSTPAGAPDLVGTLRPVDGDLDTLERFDVGAFEFAPLFLHGEGQPGTTIQLELWGEAGAIASVYWTRGAPVAPTQTAFGELDLDRERMLVLFERQAAPGPPATWSRPVPSYPRLSGKVYGFQALVDSPAAPSGRAFTNPVVLAFP